MINAQQLSVGMPAEERLVDLKEVRTIVRKSTATIYRWMAAGRFPRAYQTGPNSVAWKQSEISSWLNELQQTAQ